MNIKHGYRRIGCGLAIALLTCSAHAIQLTWFDSVDNGTSQGYRSATVADVSEAFLNYAPLGGGGPTSQWSPYFGGITDYQTQADGRKFSVSWSEYGPDRALEPIASMMSGLPAFVRSDAPGPQTLSVRGLVSWIRDADSWTPVLIRSRAAADQYLHHWGVEDGFINPTVAEVDGLDGPFFSCADYCSPVEENPYFNADGSWDVRGYLMVQTIPEPSTLTLFFIAAISVLIRSAKSRFAAFH